MYRAILEHQPVSLMKTLSFFAVRWVRSATVVLGICFPMFIHAAPRTWASADGRVLTGEFLRADGRAVTVVRSDGRSVAIPRAMLTPADQKAADDLSAAKADADRAVERKASNKGALVYQLSNGSEDWPEDRKKRIVAAMDAAVQFLNQHADFRKKLIANNSPGTPTADANIAGWINWGGSISRRVALHEIAHTLGIGTHENWQKNIKDGLWIGKNALRQLREFDGKDAVLHADRQHFWPYGLNQDNESSSINVSVVCSTA